MRVIQRAVMERGIDRAPGRQAALDQEDALNVQSSKRLLGAGTDELGEVAGWAAGSRAAEGQMRMKGLAGIRA